jgi:hypothetical protein
MSSLYEGHTYLNKICVQDKNNYTFWKALCLVEMFCLSLSVPVLAPYYKKHILSPDEVRKLCYSLGELKSVYFNLYGGREA